MESSGAAAVAAARRSSAEEKTLVRGVAPLRSDWRLRQEKVATLIGAGRLLLLLLPIRVRVVLRQNRATTRGANERKHRGRRSDE